MRAMGPAFVAELPPAFDERLSLGAAVEPFGCGIDGARQKLAASFALTLMSNAMV